MKLLLSSTVPELSSGVSDDGGIVPGSRVRDDAQVVAPKQHMAGLFPGRSSSTRSFENTKRNDVNKCSRGKQDRASTNARLHTNIYATCGLEPAAEGHGREQRN